MFAIWIWCVYLICRTNLVWSFTLRAGVSTREETFAPESDKIQIPAETRRGKWRESEMRHHEIIEILWNVRRLFEFSFVIWGSEKLMMKAFGTLRRQFAITISSLGSHFKTISTLMPLWNLKLSLVQLEGGENGETRQEKKNYFLKYARTNATIRYH